MTLRIEESQKIPGTFHVYDVDASGDGPRVAVLLPEGTGGPAVVQKIAELVNGASAEPPVAPRLSCLTDAELLALAGYAQADNLYTVAENLRILANAAPSTTGGHQPNPEPALALRAELRRRGVLP